MLTYGVLCSLAEKHGVTITENVRAFVREVERTDAAQPANEPIAWESTTFGYRKYLTQAQYERIGERFRKWYKPYRCSACTNHEASAPGLSDEEIFELWCSIPTLGGIDDDIVPFARALLTRVSASAVAEPAHSDDAAVDRFAAAMKAKLAQAREKGRGGWQQCDPVELSLMLREHVEKGDPRDVANFCMFLWNLGKPISDAALPYGKRAAHQQAEASTHERSQQLGVFLRLAEVVQADSKRTRDRYPAQSERADQLAAFMRTACKWAAQPSQSAGLPDGCKLVPKEPTDAMLDRGAEAVVAAKKIPLTGYGIAAHAWSAMYAAAHTHQHEARK